MSEEDYELLDWYEKFWVRLKIQNIEITMVLCAITSIVVVLTLGISGDRWERKVRKAEDLANCMINRHPVECVNRCIQYSRNRNFSCDFLIERATTR